MRQVISLLLIMTIVLQPLQSADGGTFISSRLIRMNAEIEMNLDCQALAVNALWTRPVRAWQRLPAYVRAWATMAGGSLVGSVTAQIIKPSSDIWSLLFTIGLGLLLMRIASLFSDPSVRLKALNLPESRIDAVDWIARIERKVGVRM